MVTVDYNLFTEAVFGADGETHGTNAIETAATLFTDAVALDFSLVAGAPAIDAGTDEHAPEDDFDGVARPQGAGIDIGAFERVQ